MRIAIDAMGGDFAPDNVIMGACEALEIIDKNTTIVLVGKSDIVTTLLNNIGVNPDLKQRLEIINADQIIEMHESPTKAVLSKTDSSIVVGLNLLKNNDVDVFSSAGNTGAILTGALMHIGLIKGVLRPCLASFAPDISNPNGKTAILDVGANADCRPEIMHQFAILGHILIRSMRNIENPKIKLLNIGEEEGKGNLLYKETYQLLKNNRNLNFCGNIESNAIFDSNVDVIITDGFTGNIVLKFAESFYETAKKVFAMLPNSKTISALNYATTGGAPILGINQPVIVGHGKSSPEAIKNMIKFSYDTVKFDLVNNFKQNFASSIYSS